MPCPTFVGIGFAVGGSRLLELRVRFATASRWVATLPVTLFYQGRVLLLNEDMGLLRGAT